MRGAGCKPDELLVFMNQMGLIVIATGGSHIGPGNLWSVVTEDGRAGESQAAGKEFRRDGQVIHELSLQRAGTYSHLPGQFAHRKCAMTISQASRGQMKRSVIQASVGSSFQVLYQAERNCMGFCPGFRQPHCCIQLLVEREWNI